MTAGTLSKHVYEFVRAWQCRTVRRHSSTRNVDLWIGYVLAVMCASLILGFSGLAYAYQARYFYDELGRLVRVVDEQGNVATYLYDSVGNILHVERNTAGNLQPRIASITPPILRQGVSVPVTIVGSNLQLSRVATNNPGIVVSRVVASDATVTATFVVSATAPTGPATASVDNGVGVATVAFTVAPPRPRLLISPNVIAIEPGKTVDVDVRLSNADLANTVLQFTGGDPTIAALAPTQLTIPAGQTTTPGVRITSGSLGTTAWTATTDAGAAGGVTVAVASPFHGQLLALGSTVSVGLPRPSLPVVGPSTVAPIAAPLVSVGLPSSSPVVGPSTVAPIVASLISVGLPSSSPVVGPSTVSPIVAPLVSVGLPSASP